MKVGKRNKKKTIKTKKGKSIRKEDGRRNLQNRVRTERSRARTVTLKVSMLFFLNGVYGMNE